AFAEDENLFAPAECLDNHGPFLKSGLHLLGSGFFEDGEGIFQGSHRLFLNRWFKDAAEVLDRVGDVLDRAGEGGSGSVGMAAAVKFFGDLEGFVVSAAEANDHGA